MAVRTDTTWVCDTCPFEELARKEMNAGWRFISIGISPNAASNKRELLLCPTCAAPVEAAIKTQRAK